MRASYLTIECAPFDRLKDVIRAACDAADDWTSPQFDYLQSYLRGDARAKTLVIEKPYVDRHYLEEYSAYYFSALRNGGPTTKPLTRMSAGSMPCYVASCSATRSRNQQN